LLCFESVTIHVLRLSPSVEHQIKTVDPVVLPIFQKKVLKARRGGNSKRRSPEQYRTIQSHGFTALEQYIALAIAIFLSFFSVSVSDYENF
jgi:hypothetical protein